MATTGRSAEKKATAVVMVARARENTGVTVFSRPRDVSVFPYIAAKSNSPLNGCMNATVAAAAAGAVHLDPIVAEMHRALQGNNRCNSSSAGRTNGAPLADNATHRIMDAYSDQRAKMRHGSSASSGSPANVPAGVPKVEFLQRLDDAIQSKIQSNASLLSKHMNDSKVANKICSDHPSILASTVCDDSVATTPTDSSSVESDVSDQQRSQAHRRVARKVVLDPFLHPKALTMAQRHRHLAN